MLVFNLTILDATQGVEEFLGDRTRLLTEVITLTGLQVVDIGDRTDDSGCTTGTCLLEGLQFLLRDRTTLYLQTEVLSDLHQTLVGDRGQDRGGLWSDIGVVLDTEEVGGTTLVNVLLLLGIEVELTGITLLMSEVVGKERCGIVATDLVLTCSEGAERS